MQIRSRYLKGALIGGASLAVLAGCEVPKTEPQPTDVLASSTNEVMRQIPALRNAQPEEALARKKQLQQALAQAMDTYATTLAAKGPGCVEARQDAARRVSANAASWIHSWYGSSENQPAGAVAIPLVGEVAAHYLSPQADCAK